MPPPSDTKRAILKCTIRLLGTNGPNALSAGAIAKELGISKATVFHHFPSLTQIPLEAFELLFEDFVDWQPPPRMTLRQLLEALGSMTFTMLDERADFLRAYYVFFGIAMFDEALKKRQKDYLALVAARITSHFVQVGLEKRVAKRCANMALVVLDGIALHALAADNRPELRRSWMAFSNMVVRENS